jgi:Tol biopolymer transport system component
MGDVYLAEDTKLGRQVALKVLTHVPEDRSGSSSRAERKQRFEREARAVAALNHPNIITIYSVEEHEGVLFLTMEYVEGRTLTDLIPREGMSLAQWLQIAIPLADAVGAAHQRGITHRDLKAANVMVGTDGRLKVLDFGLAKLRDESPIDGLSRTMSVEQPLTGEGRILGTVAYMSPEQAQGKPVDARSDVFSLGILLFEMATGQKPFQGDTSMSVLSAIIKDTPAPVTDLRADLPRDVGRVLRRCLAKDPEERYQTAKDLRADLRLLKEDVDSDASGRTLTVTATRQRPRSLRLALWLALGVVAVIAAGTAWWYAQHAAATLPSAFAFLESTRLTSTGTATVAAISPDGRYVVHDGGSDGKWGLWLLQVTTRSSTPIVPPMKGDFWGLAFSPDGENVLYVRSPTDNSAASLFRVPLLGGAVPTKLVENIDTAPAFSPDGAAMAFRRRVADGGSIIVRANADGTGQRVLAKRDRNDPYSGSRLAWSPDGTMIASFAGRPPGRNVRVVLVNADNGDERPLGDARFFSAENLFWVGDGSAIVFDAVEILRGRWNWNSQLWSIAYPAGALRRVTPNDGSYLTASATKDGRTLVTVRDELRASLWVVPDGDSTRARRITNSSTGREGATGIEWTLDGRIVYSAAAHDDYNLWIAKSDGSEPRQLTNVGGTAIPRLRPDGSGLYFMASGGTSDGGELRSIDLDGSNSRVIETGGRIFRGVMEVSGPHLYLRTQASGAPESFRVPIAGGTREPLFTDPASVPPGFNFFSVAPDGRRAAGTYSGPDGNGHAVVSIDGSARPIKIPYIYTPTGWPRPSWAPGAQALDDLVVKDGTTNIWRFPLDGSAPRPVTTFTSDDIFNYRWSRDGKTLAVSRGTNSSDVVLIRSRDPRNEKE